VSKGQKAQEEPRFTITHSRTLTGRGSDIKVRNVRALLAHAARLGYDDDARVGLLPSGVLWGNETRESAIVISDESDAASERE
jgi:hypothetical protein